jgi:rhomboid-like protein
LDLIKNEAQKVVYNKSYPVEVLEFYYYDIARMVGASGAIMGVLVAFAYYNPNTELMLIFLPVPIKAKFFIPIYMLLELFLGVGNFQWDNIAHWAHLGGALAGFLLVYFWKKDRSNFY